MKDVEHLTEEQIAIYAENLTSGTESSLPEEWLKHVAECVQCAQEVKMVSQLIEEDIKAPDSKFQNNYKPFQRRKFLTQFAIAAPIVLIIGVGLFFVINQLKIENKKVKN